MAAMLDHATGVSMQMQLGACMNVLLQTPTLW